MANTRFANATGLSGPQHYASAADLARLAAALIRDYPSTIRSTRSAIATTTSRRPTAIACSGPTRTSTA